MSCDNVQAFLPVRNSICSFVSGPITGLHQSLIKSEKVRYFRNIISRVTVPVQTKIRVMTVPSWVSLVHSPLQLLLPLLLQVRGYEPTKKFYFSSELVVTASFSHFLFLFHSVGVVLASVSGASLLQNWLFFFSLSWGHTHARREQEAEESHFLSERKLHQGLITSIRSVLITHTKVHKVVPAGKKRKNFTQEYLKYIFQKIIFQHFLD